MPLPQYEVNPSDIMIKFTAPDDRVISSVTNKVTEKVTEKLDERSLQVLSLLVEDPGYTAIAMAEKLSLSRKTISSYIKKLRIKGIIERVGSDKKGYWRIMV